MQLVSRHLCPLYAEERRELLSPVSRLHELMTLLGSDKGLIATANFLKSTGEVDIADITDEDLPTFRLLPKVSPLLIPTY